MSDQPVRPTTRGGGPAMQDPTVLRYEVHHLASQLVTVTEDPDGGSPIVAYGPVEWTDVEGMPPNPAETTFDLQSEEWVRVTEIADHIYAAFGDQHAMDIALNVAMGNTSAPSDEGDNDG